MYRGLIWAIKRIKAILRYFHWIIFNQIDIFFKNAYHVHWKLLHVAIKYLYECHLQWNSYFKSLILNSCLISIFPIPEIKKLALVSKILWCFWHNIPYMVNSFVFSLDIPVMINILYEMIKILHEKILMMTDDWIPMTTKNTHLNYLLQIYNLPTVITEPICYQWQNLSWSCIDRFLTNLKSLFKRFRTFETGLSDHHKLI